MSAPSENIELPDVPTVLGKRKWSDSDETDPVEDSDSDTNNYESQILGDYLSSSDQDDLENSDEDLEGSQSDADDDEDLDILEQEPEQGEVLWSEGEEEYPRCAIYNEKVNQHEHRLTEILNRLASRLAEITTQSESAERLHAQVIEAQQFPEPNAPLIALLGDAGTGKSALIGALTDTPFASKEVSNMFLAYQYI